MTPRTRAAGALSRPALGPVDPVLGAIVTALIGFGIVMVYSASAVEATVQMHDPHYYLKRQAIFGVGALVTMWAVSAFDYHRLRKLTYWNLAFVVLTLVVCISGLGHSGGGARRWISLGPIHVQPAEMAKLALVMWLAYSLEKKAERVTTFLVGFLPHVIVPGVLMLLCLKQPDFGSAVVLAFLSFTLMFVAGARIGYLAIATFLAGGGAETVNLPEGRRDEDEEVIEVAACGCLELEFNHLMAALADSLNRIDDFDFVVARFDMVGAFAWGGCSI